MTTVRELTKYLQGLKEELQEKQVLIECENGLQFDPEFEFVLKDYSLDKTKENVEHILIV